MTHPDEYIDLQEDFNELLGWYREDQKKIVLLQATADRRLEWLRLYEQKYWWCPVCETADEEYEHKPDCPLKKELSDG